VAEDVLDGLDLGRAAHDRRLRLLRVQEPRQVLLGGLKDSRDGCCM
jgi:hypothetical protein